VGIVNSFDVILAYKTEGWLKLMAQVETVKASHIKDSTSSCPKHAICARA